MIERIALMQHDKEVPGHLKLLLDKDIYLYSFLLALESEKAPLHEITLREEVEAKAKMRWPDWIQKVFEKVNSLIGKLLL